MKNHSKLLFLVAFFIVLWAQESLSADVVFSKISNFDDFVSAVGHSRYSSAIELSKRKQIFQKNYAAVIKYNLNAKQKGWSSRLGLNEYADRTASDLAQSKSTAFNKENNSKPNSKAKSQKKTTTKTPKKAITIPTTFSWNDTLTVSGSPIKFLGSIQNMGTGCKADYAFAAKTVAETTNAYGKRAAPVLFSAQQVIDCTVGAGCAGGSVAQGLLVYRWTGYQSESNAPYLSKKSSTCNTTVDYPTLINKVITLTTKNSINSIKTHIVQYGPMAYRFYASTNFVLYQSGIYKETRCFDVNLFTLTVIGWGSDHWIVMAPYGNTWGESGFGKLPLTIKQCTYGAFTGAIIPFVSP